MFIKVNEWTINTDQITYIRHDEDGSLDIYFVDGKKISLDAEEAGKFTNLLQFRN